MGIVRKIKRLIEVYHQRDFQATIKYIWTYFFRRLKYKFSKLSIPTLGKGGGLRIFYIDHFAQDNSNTYWLEAFRKFGKVKVFDILRETKSSLKKKIIKFCPHHIHLGGSVKNYMVPLDILTKIKNEMGSTISVFYGDAKYSPYHLKLSNIVNYIYISNKSHIKLNKKKGAINFKYMPCPTTSKEFKHYRLNKIYDLIFIGNHSLINAKRLPLLKKLAGQYNLKVFGNYWKNTGINYAKPVYGKQFSKICSKSKICVGLLDPSFSKLEAYFSNRLVNTLATKSFYIGPYTPKLEEVFTNRKHLVWYKSEKELIKLINYYLKKKKQREKIAVEGQKKVYKNYTYKKSVKKILDDTHRERILKLHLGCGNNLLEGYVNIDKYNEKANKIMDVTKLEYPNACVDEIFTSHMIGHITYSDFIKALKEWKRVLKKGGVLVIRCPNFEKHLYNWLNSSYKKRWGRNNENVNVILGIQDRGPGYLNRNIFTIKRLKELVKMSGFQVFKCTPNITRDGSIPNGDIILQARKK